MSDRSPISECTHTAYQLFYQLWPGGLTKCLWLDGWLFYTFSLTSRFSWGTVLFLLSATTSGKRGALEVESYAVKVNTPITHTGVTRLGKLLQITLQGDDSVMGEHALWKPLILLFTPVIFPWWCVKKASVIKAHKNQKNNKGVVLIFPRLKSMSINSSLWHTPEGIWSTKISENTCVVVECLCRLFFYLNQTKELVWKLGILPLFSHDLYD